MLAALGSTSAGGAHLAHNAWIGPFDGWALMLLATLVLVVPTAIVAVALGLVVARWRPHVPPTLLACATVWIVGLPLLWWGSEAVGAAQERVARRVGKRAEPLVVAIEAFAAQSGRPPEDLAELVPRYLQEIPTTGLGSWDGAFEYEARVGRWALSVPAPTGALASLVYDPDERHWEWRILD